MTAYYGTNATLRDQTVPSGKCGVGEVNGRLRVAYDEWDVPAAVIALSSTVDLFEIPSGARVLQAYCSFPDQGTTGTAKLGWLASDDAVEAADLSGFIASIDMKTAADTVNMADASTPPAGMCKKFTAKCRAQLGITEAFDAGTGTIKAWIYYILD